MGRGLQPRLRLVFNPQNAQDRRRRDSCKWSSDLKIHNLSTRVHSSPPLYTQREETEREKGGRERRRERNRKR